MNWNVISAIFKRNFAGYFSTPTGYVFICMFVVLSSLATFWPPDFFSSNLANLDQLSEYMPFILLVFVPAITMSLWAEERKEGTDELLLTIPASDFDVVLGKFLAAVAIYTVSLLFSAFSIYLVFLWGLGFPDVGLFAGTYVGYWFLGLAMLGIGMVASFLTSNLTVGFILGVIFNFPLAVAGVADAIIKDPKIASIFRSWSAAEQMRDFERGVLSISSMTYFLLIAAVAIYLSMVLIGRRHWRGGSDGTSMAGHYFFRTVALAAIAVGVSIFFSNHDWVRADVTRDRLSSLSPKTKELIRELAKDDDVSAIKVDAYVSPQVPTEYTETKLNLLATLDELSAMSGGKIQVDQHVIETFSEEANIARDTYGIEPRRVDFRRGGKLTQEDIFLGFAVTSGLDKIVVPFVDRGLPIEYELVRSIVTVGEPKRKKLGVVKTAVQLFGGGITPMMTMQEESALIRELKKQYDVIEIDPSSPIEEAVDVMLAVQPSSLDPQGMENFVEAVRQGTPVAIFEDPLPVAFDAVGTTQPNRPQQNPFGMGGQPPAPKGDVNQLFNLLGVRLVDGGNSLIWQDFNPYPKAQSLVTPEFIFIDQDNVSSTESFNNENPVSSGMRQMLLLYSGAWTKQRRSKLEYTELASTGSRTGTVSVGDAMQQLQQQRINPYAMFNEGNTTHQNTNTQYKVAVHVHGKRMLDDVLLSDVLDGTGEDESSDATESSDDASADADDAVPTAAEETEINAILVADIDWVAPVIFQFREIGQNEDFEVNWNFQNVTFLLNTIDFLVGEDRFIEIRKRERSHRLLSKIEKETENARESAIKQQLEYSQEIQDQQQNLESEFQEELEAIQNNPNLSAMERQIQAGTVARRIQAETDAKRDALERKRQQQLETIRNDLDLKIRGVQDKYKFFALILPPIPPLLVAVFVFFHRRQQEQEGVAKSRLR